MPALGSPSTSRAAFRDRNPVQRVFSQDWSAAGAARADTADWSYTVPTGKKAEIEFLYASAVNTSTTAVDGNAESYIRLVPSGGSNYTIMQSIIINGEARADIRPPTVLGGAGVLLAGDAISGRSVSTGTAGVPTGRTACKLIEADA